MIQKSVVTFYDPAKEQTIKINFEFDPEKDNLDYHTDIVPELDEEGQKGLNFFLATTFMNALLAQGESKDDSLEDNGETTSTEA